MFAKHTSQHLWGLKVSGGPGYMNLCQKDTIFLKIFQNHAHALPRFFLLEPFRAHCLLLFQGTCHFLGCLITIWVLVYPPHWSMSARAESGLLTPCPQHLALNGSSRSTHWRKSGAIPNMWPQFTLAKEHLQEAGWHSHPSHTPLVTGIQNYLVQLWPQGRASDKICHLKPLWSQQEQ